MKRDSRRLLLATSITACVAATLVSCSSEDDPAVLRASTPHAYVEVLVDCGTNGKGTVNLSFRRINTTFTVARGTLDYPRGDYLTFAQGYGTYDLEKETDVGGATLTVSTSPSVGKCTTSLTDSRTGDVLAEKESAFVAEFSVFLPTD